MKRERRHVRSAIAVALGLVMGAGPLPHAVALAQQSRDVVLTAASTSVEKVADLQIGDDQQAIRCIATDLPMLKDMDFGFSRQTFPVYSLVGDDGTRVYAVGIDTSDATVIDDVLLGKNPDMWSFALEKITKLVKDSNKTFKPYFEATGVYKPDDGSEWGEAAVVAGLSGKISDLFYIATTNLTFTGTIGLRAPFKYTEQEGAKFDKSLYLTGTLTPKLVCETILPALTNFRVKGTGTLDAEMTVLPIKDSGWNHARLNANIKLEILAVKWKVWGTTLWKTNGDMDLITPRDRPVVGQCESSPIAASNGAERPTTSISPRVSVPEDGRWYGTGDGDDRVYVDAPSQPAGAQGHPVSGDAAGMPLRDSELSTPQLGMRLLKPNVSSIARVQLVEVPDGAVLGWLEITDAGATHLMWSRYVARTDTWSEPERVCTGIDTDDYEPDFFADEAGNVHAVWLSATEAIPDEISSLDEVAGKLEVRYARLAPGSDGFGAPEIVEGVEPTGCLRSSLEVAGNGDDVVVGWSTVHADHLLDLGGDHQVVVARRTGVDGGAHGWTLHRESLDKGHDVTSLDAGLLGLEPTVAWTCDDLMMGDGGTVSRGSAPSKLRYATYHGRGAVHTNADNADFAKDGGRGVLTWASANGDGTFDLNAISQDGGATRALVSKADIPLSYQIEGDLSKSAIISYGGWQGGPNPSTDVYGRVLAQGSLSDEALLVAHADDITSHDVAYMDGAPIVAATTERSVGSQASDVLSADLLVASGYSLKRLAVTGLTYDSGAVRPAVSLPARVRVSNEGLVPLDGGVTAMIVDKATGAVLGRGLLPGTIAVGGTAEVPVIVTIPDSLDPSVSIDVEVRANFQGDPAPSTYALTLDTTIQGQSVGSDRTPAQTPVQPGRTASVGSGRPIGRSDYADSDSGSGHAESDAASATSDRPLVTRVAGADRYQTMEKVVSGAFTSSDWVVLASGGGYADTLSALALAGAHKAPVVLTARDSLSPEARSELERLGCSHVIVAGGPAAISDVVLEQTRAIAGDARRVAGADRYQTSVELMREARVAGATSDAVLVATGTSFADALSAGPASWKTGAPVLLAGPDGRLGEAAVNAVRADVSVRRVVILGGEAAVSDTVRDQLGDGYEYIRLGGADRYQTSLLVADWAQGEGIGWSRPHVATGRSFADALAAAAAAGASSSVLLLADDGNVTALTGLSEHGSLVHEVSILGGEQAVSAAIEAQVAEILG